MKIKGSSEQGLTLIETLVSLAIFLIFLGFMVPMFANQRLNSLEREIETGAVGVSQQVLDELRQKDISLLPSNPTVRETRTIRELGKDYSVNISYCQTPSYCSSEARNIRVQVNHHGQTVYEVETVYTRLQ